MLLLLPEDLLDLEGLVGRLRGLNEAFPVSPLSQRLPIALGSVSKASISPRRRRSSLVTTPERIERRIDILTIVARRLHALNRVARVAPGHHQRLARTRDRASRAPTSARPRSPRTSAPSPRARVRVIERPCTALHRARVVDVVARTISSVAQRRRARRSARSRSSDARCDASHTMGPRRVV